LAAELGEHLGLEVKLW